ncbi:toxin-antitoxin system YwqK family antitoxin [Litoribacter populi]|uniref:toxin-antitoxin system YwqK family antitoxin n=1 Tax=Litoribacter populi TaxID=2598460 RepID=UPI00163D542E|nr:hypothetical protein [Litoribacter populi]
MLDIKLQETDKEVMDEASNTLTYFFENGGIKAQGTFLMGKPEGEWKYYRETGQLWKIGHYKAGLKHGPWVRFDKNGDEEFKLKYKNGKIAVR